MANAGRNYMRISESSLRRLVRASLLSEASMATASDIARFKPQLEEWIEVLIDDMASTFPRMKDANEKQKKNLGIFLMAIEWNIIRCQDGRDHLGIF